MTLCLVKSPVYCMWHGKISWVPFYLLCQLIIWFMNFQPLIIYEEKTKEITTVKEVGICDPNYHKIRWTFALNFSKKLLMLWEAISNTRKSVLSDIQKLVFFNPLLSVWISGETVFLVFDVSHEIVYCCFVKVCLKSFARKERYTLAAGIRNGTVCYGIMCCTTSKRRRDKSNKDTFYCLAMRRS